MKLTASNTTVEADVLREYHKRLIKRGFDSEFLRTRLAYQDVHHSLSQYLVHYAGCAKCRRFPDEHDVKGVRHKYVQPERVHPDMLPTQASGRWSIKKPPKVTEPHPMQEEVIIPDPDTAWIGWDLDAIHAKIVAAYSDDEEDLNAFEKGYDIHTITSCRMLGDPLPPNLINPHTSPECEEWRIRRNWKGKDDKRRGLAKSRYCVLFCQNGKEAEAVDESAYVKEHVKQGGDRNELIHAAKLFIQAKPNLVACKKKWFDKCAKDGVARTILGRKLWLYGDKKDRMKKGWNHMIQGLEVDMLNTSLITILANPRFWLIYPSHDAAKIGVPASAVIDHREETLSFFKERVEKDWTINGHTFRSTASWSIRWPDGSKEAV